MWLYGPMICTNLPHVVPLKYSWCLLSRHVGRKSENCDISVFKKQMLCIQECDHLSVREGYVTICFTINAENIEPFLGNVQIEVSKTTRVGFFNTS